MFEWIKSNYEIDLFPFIAFEFSPSKKFRSDFRKWFLKKSKLSQYAMVWWLLKHFKILKKCNLLVEKIHFWFAWAEHPKRYSNDRKEIIFYIIVWR